MPEMPHVQWLWGVVEAYVTTFYMGKFSGETPKRHKLWSKDFRLLELIFGKAGYMSKVEQERCPGKTTRKYTDRHGKVRHVGIKDNLRNSQHFTKEFGEFIAHHVSSQSPVSFPGPREPVELPDDLSDLELFREICMPLRTTDLWHHAKMAEVVGYLGHNKHLGAKGQWVEVLRELNLG